MISRRWRAVACGIPAALLLAAAAPVENVATGAGRAERQLPAEPSRIELTSNDAEIAGRLRGIYASIEGLENVTVEVRSGVVRLGGTTLTGEQSQQAVSIAERLVGVVQVDEQITTETSVERRIAPELNRLGEFAARAVNYVPLLLVALLIFLGFWLLGRFVTLTLRPFRRLVPNRFVEGVFGQGLRIAFALAGLIVAMKLLGLTALLTSVLGAAGVLGIAAGFALRDTLENSIASILLSLRQPFGPGDHVLIAGEEGRVAVLNSRATVIVRLDGTEVRIPNATVYKAVIANFSRLPERRFEFEIAIHPSENIGRALEIATAALREVEGVLDKPASQALVDRIVDQASILKVGGWVNQTDADLPKVQSKAIRKVKAALVRAGVAMAVPVSDVRLVRQPSDEAGPPAPAQAEDETRGGEDTRPDPTIGEKARAIRASSEGDLLDPSRPRER